MCNLYDDSVSLCPRVLEQFSFHHHPHLHYPLSPLSPNTLIPFTMPMAAAAAPYPSSFRFTISCSQSDGPLRRPMAPPLRPPTPPAPPPSTINPVPPSPPPPPPPPPPTLTVSTPVVRTVVEDTGGVVTLEFQRMKAKELQEYFRQRKAEEAEAQGSVFGFLGKNEIANGRWAMFGFAVGLLTEYATGSDFVDQVKILLSNFGIVDLD
ncbi:Light-harvesting complex-like protein [Drosera capensis]